MLIQSITGMVRRFMSGSRIRDEEPPTGKEILQLAADI